MRPENLIPTNMAGMSSENFNNQINTLGQPNQVTESSEPSEDNSPSNQLVNEFQNTMETFRAMATSYVGTEEEARNVLQAMAIWLEKANQVINDGGQSNPTY